MELVTQNLNGSISAIHTMTGSLSSVGSMSGKLSIPQSVAPSTDFIDAGDGNIVITSTTLTATDDGGNISIEG